MENKPSQPNNPPTANTNSSGQPQTNQPQQPAPAQTDPKRKPINYVLFGLGVLIVAAIFLPNSTFAQALAYPIWLCGAAAGILFFIDTINSSKSKSPLVRSFIILGGVGVGVVIFVICLVAGAFVGFSKDPNPQSTG